MSNSLLDYYIECLASNMAMGLIIAGIIVFVCKFYGG